MQIEFDNMTADDKISILKLQLENAKLQLALKTSEVKKEKQIKKELSKIVVKQAKENKKQLKNERKEAEKIFKKQLTKELKLKMKIQMQKKLVKKVEGDTFKIKEENIRVKEEKIKVEKENIKVKEKNMKQKDEQISLLKDICDKSMSSAKYIIKHYNHKNTLKKLNSIEIRKMLGYRINKNGEKITFDNLGQSVNYIKMMYDDKKLIEHIGDVIISKYLKNDDERSFFSTDLNRLNYIVRTYKGGKFLWQKDKGGDLIKAQVINPMLHEICVMIADHCKNKKYLERMKEDYDRHMEDPDLISEYTEWHMMVSAIEEKMNSNILSNNILNYITTKFHFNNPTKAIEE